MLQKTFLNSLLLCITLAHLANAEITATVLPARILGASYPNGARLGRIEGIVEAKCLIREDGSVAEVYILSGHPVLARSVKENLLQWTFRWANGTNNRSYEARILYDFQLRGNCDHHRGCKEQFWFEYPERVTIFSELPYINFEKSPEK
jgi:hypothetical protein